MVYKVIICIFILPNKMNFSKQILGSSLLLPAYGREGQGQHLFNWRRISQSEIRNSAAAKARAGREFISPTPPFLPAPPERSVLVSAARSAAIKSFAQKRFALRSVIATNLNIANFAGSLLARSPRLRRGFARIFPYISAQNQRAFENQKSVFCPAGGGSGRRSRQSKNTPLKNLLKCFCSPIFSACPDKVGTLRSQFFNPALFSPSAEWLKATY